MTAKQIISYAKKYAYLDDFHKVLEEINMEIQDTCVELENHFKDAFTKSLKKYYADLLEKRDMILFMQEQRLVLLKKAGY